MQTIDVCQYHQKIGVHQIGHQCRQSIVVTEHFSDLVNRHHVVFVQDWDNPQVQQTLQGVSHIQIRLAVVQVFDRQQYLGNLQSVDLKQFLIGVHQPALSDGGPDLPGRDV